MMLKCQLIEQSFEIASNLPKLCDNPKVLRIMEVTDGCVSIKVGLQHIITK